MKKTDELLKEYASQSNTKKDVHTQVFTAKDDCLTDDCCDIACCCGSVECCDCLMDL